MTTIRRVLVIALAVLAVLAPAAGAHDHHGAGDEAPMEVDGHERRGYEAGDPDRNGVDGTDPIAFVALLVAGIATVGAVATLIFGPRRVPA